MNHNRDALEQLGRRIGLPDLKFNGEGICELTVGDNIEVYLEGEPDATVLHLNGVIGTLPAADDRVLRALLGANYNGQATGAAALAMDPRTSEIVLTRQLDVSALDAAKLAETLETFVKYVAFWIGYLPKMAVGTPPDAPAGPGASSGSFIRA
jgi:hypothetical protein